MSSNLREMLQLAVLLWQAKLRDIPMDDLLPRIKGAGQLIAERGDVLLFGGGKKGEIAEIFNRMAEAIAVMSFLPGGITILGQHWEAERNNA